MLGVPFVHLVLGAVDARGHSACRQGVEIVPTGSAVALPIALGFLLQKAVFTGEADDAVE